MHAFRLINPFPVAQLRFMCLLAEIHSNPKRRTLIRLNNQAHVVQIHRNAVWGTPSQVIPRGLTYGHIHLTSPFSEYMRIQIEALFDTEPIQSPLRSLNPFKACHILDVISPRVRITFAYAAVIIQGIGNGELIDSDKYFEELIQHLIDLRTDFRLSLLMALHPRLGASSPLSYLGEDIITHTLRQVH
jgi:hypothetical protein